MNVLPNHLCLAFTGRYNETEDRSTISFDAPGFQIDFGVKGVSQIDILLSVAGLDNPHRFWVYIDGIVDTHSMIDTSSFSAGEITQVNVANGISTSFHSIRVVKVTEADWNNPYPEANFLSFHGLLLDGGEVSCLADPPASRRIEYIGDSITAGYCNMCKEYPDAADYVKESFAMSWPTLVSAALNASQHAVAWSGFGLVRNCCGGDTHMPEVYQRTLASVSDGMQQWDFTKWVPDAVVINLGTNDNLNDQGIADRYEEEYIQFIKNISSFYQPANAGAGPVFFLACGPMSEAYCPYVMDVIDQLKDDYSVVFLDQRNLLNSSNQCCGHPDAAADQTIAEVTLPIIRDTMRW